MRDLRYYQVGFRNRSFLMHAINDAWGIDDLVISEMEKGRYNEGDALCWWMAIIVTSGPKSIVVDVGAYTGLYSFVACAQNPAIRVIAFEASAVTLARFFQNVLLNKLDTRITPSHLAITDRRGIAELGHGFGITSMASGESLEPAYKVDHTEIVPTIGLDELLLQKSGRPIGAIASKALSILPVSNIAGIKIDVEGAELAVICGAEEVLRCFKPSIIVEILSENHLIECDAYLSKLGYERLAHAANGNYIYAVVDKAPIIRAAYAAIKADGSDDFVLAEISSFAV